MKKTLKRELKLFEIVESDAFVVSVCLCSSIFFLCWDESNLLSTHLKALGNSGLAPVTEIKLQVCVIFIITLLHGSSKR